MSVQYSTDYLVAIYTIYSLTKQMWMSEFYKQTQRYHILQRSGRTIMVSLIIFPQSPSAKEFYGRENRWFRHVSVSCFTNVTRHDDFGKSKFHGITSTKLSVAISIIEAGKQEQVLEYRIKTNIGRGNGYVTVEESKDSKSQRLSCLLVEHWMVLAYAISTWLLVHVYHRIRLI